MKDLYHDRPEIKETFNPEYWSGYKGQREAGLDEIYDRVNALDPDLVIDAGCGRNQHKEHIKNLVGFDPSPFPNVDFVSTILEAEFDSESADAVLALGSVQFISEEYIIENMKKIVSWVKPGGLIEMRGRVGPPGEKVHKHWYNFDDDLQEKVMKLLDLEYLVEPTLYPSDMPHIPRSYRIRWTWRKKDK